MDINTFKNIESNYRRFDISYLPFPNHQDVVFLDTISPASITATAFCFTFIDETKFIMASNVRRGLNTPGGHVETGESVEQAAIRETMEEVGAKVSKLIPVGCLRSTISGLKPNGYKYPYPVSSQMFFAAIADKLFDYKPNDECSIPEIILDENAKYILTTQEYILYKRAWNLLFRNNGGVKSILRVISND